jgi:hypothetical protein
MSPLAFFIQVLLLLALALVVLFALVGGKPTGPGGRLRRRAEPILQHERYIASGLGWSFNAWLLLRASALLVGATAGWLVGTPVVVVGFAAVGFLGVPWWLSARATQRKLEMDRALIPLMINLVNLLSQGQQTLNHALKDLSRNPDPRLAAALRPLRNADSVSDALVEVAELGMSPMLDRVCVDLLLSMDQTPEAFIQQAEKNLIPQYDQDLDLQTRNHASVAGGRQNGLLVILVMGFCFFALMRVDSLRATYETFVGQLLLVVDGAMVMGVLMLLGAMVPRTVWVRWDLRAVRDQLRKRYA